MKFAPSGAGEGGKPDGGTPCSTSGDGLAETVLRNDRLNKQRRRPPPLGATRRHSARAGQGAV